MARLAAFEFVCSRTVTAPACDARRPGVHWIPPGPLDKVPVMRLLIRTGLLLLAVGVAACGRNSPTGPTVPLAPPSGLSPTLSSIQREIFNPTCVEHHGVNDIDGDLDLRDGQSYAQLVNHPAFQVTLDRVEPNDPQSSYLIYKLEGQSGIVGDRMPPSAPFLTSAQIDVIRQWINAGAQNN